MNLLYPLALFALVSLPIIFIISKIIPPNPKPQTLPAFDFLRGLNAQKAVNDAPFWLKLLRAFGILLLVLVWHHRILARKKRVIFKCKTI